MRLEPSERITWAVTGGLGPSGGTGVRHASLQATRSRATSSAGSSRSDATFEIEPDLAERFTVSDDGRSYRFTLRPDARWSDGAPVTADDFAFTFAQMAEDERDRPPPASTG